MTNGRGASWHKTINLIAIITLFIIILLACCDINFNMFEDGSVRLVIEAPFKLFSFVHGTCVVPAWGC